MSETHCCDGAICEMVCTKHGQKAFVATAKKFRRDIRDIRDMVLRLLTLQGFPEAECVCILGETVQEVLRFAEPSTLAAASSTEGGVGASLYSDMRR